MTHPDFCFPFHLTLLVASSLNVRCDDNVKYFMLLLLLVRLVIMTPTTTMILMMMTISYRPIYH